MTNNGEAGATEHMWEVGNSGYGGSVGRCGDTVGGHLNWPQTGDCGSVGGAATDVLSINRGEGLQGGGGGGSVENHGGNRMQQKISSGKYWRISHERPE